MLDKAIKYFKYLSSTPGAELDRLGRFIRFQIRLWRACLQRLWTNNVMAMSAALSFRTIFALVPIMVLGFLMMRSIGALDETQDALHRFLVTSGFSQIKVVNDSSHENLEGPPMLVDHDENPQVINLADKMAEIVDSVEGKLTLGRIGPVGVLLLIWSAMTLLSTLERSLNRIFEVRHSRSIRRRILIYWTVLTLGPLIFAATAYAGREALQAAARTPVISWLLVPVGWLGPILVGILLIAALYRFMPNTHVRTLAALGGAAMAVPAWLVAKWGFSLYIQNCVGTQRLYGTLALFPLFLIWVNFSWWIFLFGAQLACAAANLERFHALEEVERIELGPLDRLACVVSLARSYLSGSGPVSIAKLAQALQLPGLSVNRLLDQLAELQFVCRVEPEAQNRYVLSCPPECIPLLKLLELEQQPADDHTTLQRYDPALRASIEHVRALARESLGDVTLAEVLETRPALQLKTAVSTRVAESK